MALNLTGKDGELDRRKVIAELDAILNRLPIPFGPQLDGIKRVERGNLINLIDSAVNQAYVDTERWCRSNG